MKSPLLEIITIERIAIAAIRNTALIIGLSVCAKILEYGLGDDVAADLNSAIIIVIKIIINIVAVAIIIMLLRLISFSPF
jgi:hypothetical protein